MRYFAVLALITLALPAVGHTEESFEKLNDKGVLAYGQQDFDKAREYLEKAADIKPDNPIVNFNLGNAYHQQGEYDKADQAYISAAQNPDSNLSAMAYYNIGNTQFRKGDYEKAIESYKRSLALNPDDLDAKYNLEVARKMLEEQKQQQQQKKQEEQEQKQDQEQQQQQDQKQQGEQQKQDDKQDQQKDQQKEEKQKQDEQSQNQQDQQQEQQQEQQKQQNKQQQDQQDEQQQNQQQSGEEEQDQQRQQQQQAQPREMEMSEEDAERILNAVTGNDKEVLRRLVRQKAPSGGYSGKDW